MGFEADRRKYFRWWAFVNIGFVIGVFCSFAAIVFIPDLSPLASRIIFSALVLSYVGSFIFFHARIQANYLLLPATMQFAIDRQTRERRLGRIVKIKRWMKWLPFVLALSLLKIWREGIEWRWIVVGMITACFVGAWLYLRQMRESVKRLDEKLVQSPIGE